MFGCILYIVIKLTCLNFGDPNLYVSNGQNKQTKKKITLCSLKTGLREGGVENEDKSSCLGPSAKERA